MLFSRVIGPIGLLLGAFTWTGCSLFGDEDDGENLEAVAVFQNIQITGVAVSDDRLFVNSPYWTDDHSVSVMEVMDSGSIEPYPNDQWNTWSPGTDPGSRFVCVQSVYIDQRNPGTLWVLDPASPRQQGVVPGGAKLVRIDLATDQVDQTIVFDSTIAPAKSYLNDVRVDSTQRWAYITDSGLGALVVVNLETGSARRLLENHPSVKADSGYVIRINGEELRDTTGQVPKIHSDGIALTHDDSLLYYHPLTGDNLYRIRTSNLRDASITPEILAARVENVDRTVVTDGMIADAEGYIYHTALEQNAILRYTPDGDLETVLQSDELQWPDSFSFGPNGDLYVTISLIHQMPQYNGGESTRTEPYRVFRIPMNR